jgi:hypothetical protein
MFLLHSFSAGYTSQVHYLWRVNLICATSEQLDRQHTETPQPATHQYIEYTTISSQQEEKRIRTTNPQHRQDLTYLLCTHLLTRWSRVLPEKLTGPQPVKKFPALMESERSLPHSLQPTTCPCPEPDQPRRCPHIPLPEDPS